MQNVRATSQSNTCANAAGGAANDTHGSFGPAALRTASASHGFGGAMTPATPAVRSFSTAAAASAGVAGRFDEQLDLGVGLLRRGGARTAQEVQVAAVG
jgi:hypothetical protein